MTWLLSKLLAAPAPVQFEWCPIAVDDWVQRGDQIGWVMRFEPGDEGLTNCFVIVEPEEGGWPERWHIQEVTRLGSRRD
jgi:hypothetical protein